MIHPHRIVNPLKKCRFKFTSHSAHFGRKVPLNYMKIDVFEGKFYIIIDSPSITDVYWFPLDDKTFVGEHISTNGCLKYVAS